MPLGETIVAAATPRGESAIAAVRISGPLCLSLIREALHIEAPKPRYATLAYYTDKENQCIDQVLFTYFPDNSSYTGEPLAEIYCHGNPLIIQKMIADLIARGCRLAEGGEFTRTAYLNGKIDLSQAEAVCDLIHASSEEALSVAHKQLAGSLRKKVSELTEELLQISAEVEAYIDFPEDDLPPQEIERIQNKINTLILNIEELIRTSEYKPLLQKGIKTVIIGPPNAGKSTLLNALIGEERAIVSDIPGTTRDFISEQVMMGPYCLRLMDTAGIHHSEDTIEKLGIEKTLERIQDADFHIVMLDATQEAQKLPSAVIEALQPKSTLVVFNKMDLAREKQTVPTELMQYRYCQLSLKEQDGLPQLRDSIVGSLKKDLIKTSEDGLIINTRHASALKKATEALIIAKDGITEGKQYELVASDLMSARNAISEIVGKIDCEDVLDRLFSTFCIGK